MNIMSLLGKMRELKRRVRRAKVWFFRKKLMKNASDIRISVREIIDCVQNGKDFTWTMYVIGQRRGIKAMKCEYCTHKLIVMARDRHIFIENVKFLSGLRDMRKELDHILYHGIIGSGI